MYITFIEPRSPFVRNLYQDKQTAAVTWLLWWLIGTWNWKKRMSSGERERERERETHAHTQSQKSSKTVQFITSLLSWFNTYSNCTSSFQHNSKSCRPWRLPPIFISNSVYTRFIHVCAFEMNINQIGCTNQTINVQLSHVQRHHMPKRVTWKQPVNIEWQRNFNQETNTFMRKIPVKNGR